MSKHEFHEFASMFPLMEGAELAELISDIEAHGQHEAIVMLDNKVLDGRNRYNACLRLKIKPRMRDFNCIDGNPLDFVWSANVNRRHLTQSQRGLAMAKKTTFLAVGYVAGQSGGSNGLPLSIEAAAKAAQVSGKTMKRAKIVVQHGSDEDIAAVERGEVSVNAVADKILPTIPKVKLTTRALDFIADTSAGAPRIHVPAGQTTEQLARVGLKLEDEHGMTDVPAVAKKLGISDDSYKKIREIVMIADHPDLNARDRDLATAALKFINENQRSSAYSLIEPISRRIWGINRRKNKETEVSRTTEFEKKIEILLHVCATELEIPQLSKDQLKYTYECIESSIDSLKALTKQIKEIYGG